MGTITEESPLPGAYDLEGSCRYLGGIGRTTLYGLIKAGELKAIKIAGRTVIARADLDDYLNRLRAR